MRKKREVRGGELRTREQRKESCRNREEEGYGKGTFRGKGRGKAEKRYSMCRRETNRCKRDRREAMTIINDQKNVVQGK